MVDNLPGVSCLRIQAPLCLVAPLVTGAVLYPRGGLDRSGSAAGSRLPNGQSQMYPPARCSLKGEPHASAVSLTGISTPSGGCAWVRCVACK